MQDKPVVASMNPLLCADLGDGYIQNRLGLYHRASSRDMPFGEGQSACFLLENLKDSRANIFMAATRFVNLSATPMRVSLYTPCAGLSGAAERDVQVSAACLLTGANLQPYNARPACTLTVGPYQTGVDSTRGGVCIARGQRLMAICEALTPGRGLCAFCAAWWEESV